MVRTQIYLTEKEQIELKSIAQKTGKKQSELIRQAIDIFLAQHNQIDRKELLKQARGIWKDRTDLPDFDKIRREWDRIDLK